MLGKEGILTKEESELIEKKIVGKNAYVGKEYKKRMEKKKKPKMYESAVGYDFLKYIRIVFFWATKKYDIRRKDIELLLYLYPIGNFTLLEFNKIARVHSMYVCGIMKHLREKGFIEVWREPTKKRGAMWCLSSKARVMCKKMHNILAGDEEISQNYNPLVNGTRSSEKYYLNLICMLNEQNGKRIEINKKEKASSKKPEA